MEIPFTIKSDFRGDNVKPLLVGREDAPVRAAELVGHAAVGLPQAHRTPEAHAEPAAHELLGCKNRGIGNGLSK